MTTLTLRSISIPLLTVLLALFLGSCEPVSRKHALDTSQAEMMVSFLRRVNAGEDSANLIDSLMRMEGTGLIVGQLNLSRRVLPGQYRTVLEGLAHGAFPDIKPADSTVLSIRGIEGLKRGVWRALTWGVKNTDLLSGQIDSIKQVDIYEEAKRTALAFLPENVALEPRLFVVAGGRAGAAAIEGKGIYLDILVMTGSRLARGLPLLTRAEYVEFFAHEVHHLGLGDILQRRYGSVPMDLSQRQLFTLLKSIISEGVPTYFINSHRNPDEVPATVPIADKEMSVTEALRWTQDLTRRIIQREFSAEDEFERANLLMTGMGYHNLGAHMMSVIDRAGGKERVMEAILDPPLLLKHYNGAVQSSQNPAEHFQFEPDLVAAAARLFMAN